METRQAIVYNENAAVEFRFLGNNVVTGRPHTIDCNKQFSLSRIFKVTKRWKHFGRCLAFHGSWCKGGNTISFFEGCRNHNSYFEETIDGSTETSGNLHCMFQASNSWKQIVSFFVEREQNVADLNTKQSDQRAFNGFQGSTSNFISVDACQN